MRIRISLSAVLSVILMGHAHSQTPTDDDRWGVKRLVEFHQQHHPGLKVQDVYKLLYQASFGVEHILADSISVAGGLHDELATIGTPLMGEPLMERISLENEIVRVNLRPFKALNLDPSLLVKVMLQSARETSADTMMFYREWNEFSSLVRFELLQFSVEDLKLWNEKVEGGRFETVHHSPNYVAADKPAYRVVRRDVFEEVFGKAVQ